MQIYNQNVDWVSHKSYQRPLLLSVSPCVRFLLQDKAFGLENIPQNGPFLLCPKHTSWLDPFLHIRREMRIMGKSEVFNWPILGYLFPYLGAFPVRRNQNDRHAMEIARQILLSGQGLLLYPEGTRRGRENAFARRGAAVLAIQTGVPVIPCASVGLRDWGTGPRLKIPRVRTIFGSALEFKNLELTEENINQVRDQIWREINICHTKALEL